MYYDDENATQDTEASPFVSKMQQYVDIERGIERMQSDAHRLEKEMAEARSLQAKIRRDLVGYLEPERDAQKAAIEKAMAR